MYIAIHLGRYGDIIMHYIRKTERLLCHIEKEKGEKE
jgi:hypothetical protein